MDYYDSLITGGKQGVKKDIDKKAVSDLISEGLSSVKISKIVGVSYPTIGSFVKKQLPELMDKLKENGRLSKIRKHSWPKKN